MLPVRGATPFCGEPADLFFDFNPCSPCGERLSPGVITTSASTISIHAPRAGSDFFAIMSGYLESHFNPCSPCGERHHKARRCRQTQDFNPCSPCGERLVTTFPFSAYTLFQSMLPVRGATIKLWYNNNRKRISIHAPRAGSDASRIYDVRIG